MHLFALLPPLPMENRLIVGLLATLFAGALNLVFRRAAPRWSQWTLALVVSPATIWLISYLGENSGQRTPYAFWGAVAGIAVVRGRRPPGPISAFGRRTAVVVAGFVLMGPPVGLGFHYLRYVAGVVKLDDAWEIQLSLEDGVDASITGAFLALVLVLGSVMQANLRRGPEALAAPQGPEAAGAGTAPDRARV
jgi:hypothetical protein